MTKRLLKASLSAETTLMFPAGRRPDWEKFPCPAKKSVPIRHPANFQTRPSAFPGILVGKFHGSYLLDLRPFAPPAQMGARLSKNRIIFSFRKGRKYKGNPSGVSLPARGTRQLSAAKPLRAVQSCFINKFLKLAQRVKKTFLTRWCKWVLRLERFFRV